MIWDLKSRVISNITDSNMQINFFWLESPFNKSLSFNISEYYYIGIAKLN